MNRAFQGRPFDLMVALALDLVHTSVLAMQPTDGIPQAERAAQIAALDEDILRLEVSEERALREGEEATRGADARRVDANAEVLRAPTEELQG